MHPPALDGQRIAFFGGSFDPPHLGHLAIARAARAALHLDSVLFAPVGAQPLKPLGSTASFADRLAMTRLAIAGEEAFGLSLADAPAPASTAPNFTYDTLLRIRAELPPSTRLFCLMGADSFLGLRHWHRGAEIPFVAPLIVAARPGQPLDELARLLPPGLAIETLSAPAAPSHSFEVCPFTLRNPAGAAAPFYLLPGLNFEISASAIRQQVRSAPGHRPASLALLPPPVFDYIATHGLYR